MTPDIAPGEGGAILEKKLPERNPPPLFGLGTIFCSGKYNVAFFQSAIMTLQTLVIALGAGLACGAASSSGKDVETTIQVQMLMCHKVTDENLTDNSSTIPNYLMKF